METGSDGRSARHHLVDRNARLNVRTRRFSNTHAGQKGSVRARMIPGAIISRGRVADGPGRR
jgi:hypothetical protein